MRFLYRTFWGEQGSFQFRRTWIDLEGKGDNDYIIRQITKYESFYEEELLHYLSIYIPHGGLFVDIGANIGNHSVFFGKFLAEQVYCFEPYKLLQEILKRNLQRNNVKKYKIFSCALGGSEAMGALVFPDETNVGMTRVKELDSGDQGGSHLGVRIRRLDDVLTEDGATTVRLIKIDVEGMELAVLKGAKRILTEDKPHLIIEAATAKEKDSLDSFLAAFGYQAIRVFCATPTYHFIHKERLPQPRLSRVYSLVKKLRAFF